MVKQCSRSDLCYLRTYRRNWGLTQRELAELIGTASAVQISRYENNKRAPKIEVALACQAIFGVPPSIMFPDAYTRAEDEVMRNMCRIDQRLEHTTSLLGLRKRELFSLALARAVRSSRNRKDK